MEQCKRRKSTKEMREQVFRRQLRYRLCEGCLMLALTFSVFLFIALLSYHRSDPGWSHNIAVKHVANVTGKAGAWISDFTLYMVGYLAYIFPLIIVIFASWVFLHNRNPEENILAKWPLLILRIFGFLLILLAGSSLAAIYVGISALNLPYNGGGIMGTVIMNLLFSAFNAAGTSLLLIAFLFIGITLFTGLSWFHFLELLGKNGIRLTKFFIEQFGVIFWKNLFQSFLPSQDKLKKVSVILKVKRVKPGLTLDSLDMSSALKIVERPKISIVDHKFKMLNFKGSVILPELSLLDQPSQGHIESHSEEELWKKSREIELRLADFGIQVKVVAVHPGPVVTRFELQLSAGTKASRVTNLSKDLARSLSVISVRIVEIIPGKSVIGLELPNKHREIVTLYEVLSTKQYQNSHSSLTLALGKDIGGHPVIVDLAKMPHLLIAGTTGSGKSVGLHAILLSLLYKSTPQQLRLILIDPKMLELSIYEGIPHLLTPVVTNMKNAAAALQWCITEMERRYCLMTSLGVRNILGYNVKVKELIEAGDPLLDQSQTRRKDKLTELQELPQLVIIADEFSDMMVVVGKKIETLIVRLAQKARAAGIHLIFATQRPSVDVITGLIKANIPTRMSFQVSSKIDSRTILDQQGAEQLLGYGDLLYLAPGSGVPVRVHGPYVKDGEVHRVAEYLRKSSKPNYVKNILDEIGAQDLCNFVEATFESRAKDGGEGESFYDEAVETVIRSRHASVPSIQRRFKIGYNRAARVIKAMETASVVSPIGNDGAREVLVPSKEKLK